MSSSGKVLELINLGGFLDDDNMNEIKKLYETALINRSLNQTSGDQTPIYKFTEMMKICKQINNLFSNEDITMSILRVAFNKELPEEDAKEVIKNIIEESKIINCETITKPSPNYLSRVKSLFISSELDTLDKRDPRNCPHIKLEAQRLLNFVDHDAQIGQINIIEKNIERREKEIDSPIGFGGSLRKRRRKSKRRKHKKRKTIRRKNK